MIGGHGPVIPTEIDGRENLLGVVFSQPIKIIFDIYLCAVFLLGYAGGKGQAIVTEIGEGFLCISECGYWGSVILPFSVLV